MTLRLSNEQLLASKHMDGPALVLAVPGAGKTTLLIHRTKKLIDKGIKPSNILSITFSKAAALNMEDKFNTMFPGCGKVKFATIHSFSFGIINQYKNLRGKKLLFMEDKRSPGQRKIISNIFKSLKSDRITDEKITTCINEISYVKNMYLDPKEFQKDSMCQTPNLPLIYNKYEAFKKQNGLFDFDDMIIMAYDILKSDKYLLQKIRNQFKYIQLDEGQDTSMSQFKLIKLIASPKNNLFIVADDDQNIYSFRGAESSNLMDLKKDYLNLAIYHLNKNYRSSKNIVDVAGAFIEQNKKRFDKDFVSEKDYLEPVNISKFSSIEIFEKFLIDEVSKDEEVAILYRNNVSSLTLAEILERRGFSFRIYDRGMSFYNNPIIYDIKDILDFANDRGDYQAFKRICFKVKGYISKSMRDYMACVKSDDILEDLKNFPNLKPFYHKSLSELGSALDTLKGLSPSYGVQYILDTLEYEKYLKNDNFRYLKSTGSEVEFLELIKNVSKHSGTFTEFFGKLKFLDSILKESSNKDSHIYLSTIHGAKGLEFDKVIIVDLYENNLPSKASLDFLHSGDSTYFEEERRLLYVGMTRAKKKLILTYIEYEGTQISRFLTELKGL